MIFVEIHKYTNGLHTESSPVYAMAVTSFDSMDANFVSQLQGAFDGIRTALRMSASELFIKMYAPTEDTKDQLGLFGR